MRDVRQLSSDCHLKEEPGHRQLHPRLEAADEVAIGAPTLFETAMVAIGRFGEEGEALVEQFLDDWRIEVLPFGEKHWVIADDAFVRYGKGRHPAALNYGDCMGLRECPRGWHAASLHRQ